MAKGFVYFLKSIETGRFYIGSTNDIGRRLTQHQRGEVKSTRNFLPIKLEFFQEFDNISQARQIEQKLKRLKRKDYIQKILKDRSIKLGQ